MNWSVFRILSKENIPHSLLAFQFIISIKWHISTSQLSCHHWAMTCTLSSLAQTSLSLQRHIPKSSESNSTWQLALTYSLPCSNPTFFSSNQFPLHFPLLLQCFRHSSTVTSCLKPQNHFRFISSLIPYQTENPINFHLSLLLSLFSRLWV